MKQGILGQVGAVCAILGLAGSAVAQAPLRPGVTNLPVSVGARLGSAVKPKGERIAAGTNSLFAAPGAFLVMIFAGGAAAFSIVKISKSGGSNPPTSP